MKNTLKITLSIILFAIMAFFALSSGSTKEAKDFMDGFVDGYNSTRSSVDEKYLQKDTDTLSNNNLATVTVE